MRRHSPGMLEAIDAALPGWVCVMVLGDGLVVGQFEPGRPTPY